MENNEFLSQLGQFRKKAQGKVPSQNQTFKLLERIVKFLFPIFCEVEKGNLQAELDYIKLDLKFLLQSTGFSSEEAIKHSNAFENALPEIYNKLLLDAKAIFDGDPAAESIEEVVVSYPGFYAIIVHRLAHQLYNQAIPVIPRLFSEYVHRETGIDIHPGAEIGESFCIDHGTGIVIGETCKIGDFVKIYQGVTLGALSVSKSKGGTKRHPTIESHVTIYSGSTILGGNTVVGAHSVIGGNVWLTSGIEPYSAVLNKSEVYVKNRNPEYDTVIDFVI